MRTSIVVPLFQVVKLAPNKLEHETGHSRCGYEEKSQALSPAEYEMLFGESSEEVTRDSLGVDAETKGKLAAL